MLSFLTFMGFLSNSIWTFSVFGLFIEVWRFEFGLFKLGI
jgi:hypothetical protein